MDYQKHFPNPIGSGFIFSLIAWLVVTSAALAAPIGPNDFRISNMGPDGSTNYSAGGPSVAYNNADNEFLVVWSGDDNTPPLADEDFEIFGQRINAASGALIGSRFRISDMGPDGDPNYAAAIPTVVYNSIENEYLVIWQGDDNTPPLVNSENEIFGQRLSAAGVEIGANDFRISDMGPDGDAAYDANSLHAVFNNVENEYLVVWQGDDNTGALVDGESEVYGQRIDGATGAEVGANDFRISDMGPDGNGDYRGTNPAAAFNSNNNEYLIVWHGDDNILPLIDGEDEVFGQRLAGATGVEVGANDFRISDMGPNGDVNFRGTSPAPVYNGINNEYLVVWNGDDNTAPLVDNELEIFGQRLNGVNGAELGTNDFRISDMGPDGDTAFEASTSFAAYDNHRNEYLILWQGRDDTGSLVSLESEIYSQLINAASGAEIGGDTRISDMGPDGDANFGAFGAATAFNSTNRQFLITWSGDDNTAPLIDEEFEVFGQLFGEEADLLIVKSDSSDPAASGGTLSYTLSVTNSGPGTALSVEVLDPLPAGMSFSSATGTDWSCDESGGTVTCGIATLNSGAFSDITLNVSIDSASSGIINNAAAVSSLIFDGQSADNMDTESTEVVSVKCSLKKMGQKCKQAVAPGTICKLKTTNIQNDSPKSGASYELTRRGPGGDFISFKKLKVGVTEANGRHVLKLRIKKTITVRSEFANPQCVTKKIKFQVEN